MVNISSKESLPLMIISIPMAVIAVIFSIWGAVKSFEYAKKNPKKNSKYFQYTAMLSNLFNCGSCICVATYLIWLTFWPLTNDDFFLTHTSIRLRVATTASWYAAKIFLFLIFNGRLFYAFRNSKYRSNERLFKCLNWFVFIHAIISLIIGYVGVLELGNEIVANIGFNTFHVNLAILLFYLSIQFNRRMFSLSTTRVKIELSRSHNDPREFVEFSSFTTKTVNMSTDAEETTATTSTDVCDPQQDDIQYDDEYENDHCDHPSQQQLKATNSKDVTLRVNVIEASTTKTNSENESATKSVSDPHETSAMIPNHNSHKRAVVRSKSRDSNNSSSPGSNKKGYRRHIYREDSIVSNREFLRIVTRSTLLLTWIIPFMISISLTWSLHRFVFDTTHFSMCIALMVMSLDAFIDIICVLLLFKYCDQFYNGLCRCSYTNIQCESLSLDWCCAACCHKLAKKCVD